MPASEPSATDRLLDDGFLERDGDRLCTTPRWRAALARAAAGLQHTGAPWTGLKLPIAMALAERHAELSDETLAALVEAMLPHEEAALAESWGVLGG
ncbi:MAG: hypothetical protein QM704_00190 [Anaeromyxobacteraceae bacterium]